MYHPITYISGASTALQTGYPALVKEDNHILVDKKDGHAYGGCQIDPPIRS